MKQGTHGLLYFPKTKALYPQFHFGRETLYTTHASFVVQKGFPFKESITKYWILTRRDPIMCACITCRNHLMNSLGWCVTMALSKKWCQMQWMNIKQVEFCCAQNQSIQIAQSVFCGKPHMWKGRIFCLYHLNWNFIIERLSPSFAIWFLGAIGALIAFITERLSGARPTNKSISNLVTNK